MPLPSVDLPPRSTDRGDELARRGTDGRRGGRRAAGGDGGGAWRAASLTHLAVGDAPGPSCDAEVRQHLRGHVSGPGHTHWSVCSRRQRQDTAAAAAAVAVAGGGLPTRDDVMTACSGGPVLAPSRMTQWAVAATCEIASVDAVRTRRCATDFSVFDQQVQGERVLL